MNKVTKKEPYFSKDMFRFLQELQLNNNRAWFAAHKTDYERLIREPSLRFIADIGPKLEKISKYLSADPRPVGGSLFRIYRDTRFSKDKTPYKTHVAMHFPIRLLAGKGTPHAAGFYLHFEPGECFGGGGIWHPDPENLAKIRGAIVAHPKEWSTLRKKIDIEGDALKRPPAGYDPSHPFIDDLKMKDFFASTALTDAQVTGSHLLDLYADMCKEISPLVKFLNKAIGMPW